MRQDRQVTARQSYDGKEHSNKQEKLTIEKIKPSRCIERH